CNVRLYFSHFVQNRWPRDLTASNLPPTIRGDGHMRGFWIAAVLLGSLFLATAGLAQEGINATLSGTVSDSTGALIPGVEVTARNIATGVKSIATTNESGTYRFPSLQPGSYEAAAALSGFQTQTFRLNLGTSQNIRQNFTLQVGAVTQAVEVT